MSSIKIPAGQYGSLNVTVATLGGPGPPIQAPAWTTSDATKVTFMVGGVQSTTASGTTITILALAAGSATVTCTLGSHTDTCDVTVDASPEANVTGITVTAAGA